ncbi:hypothetical protein CK203_018326 [Vitis vinifera]|uniref:Retrovirus-related Pol polyprotein from transposon TNT 1-94 n=1 Tax=Vitis vinifera TaxID=29760 RepID=A0A438JP06_VITVI|nr:hypothetical protein CK203_018326 [Vitis vinifera]
MLHAKNVPGPFWAEVMKTAAFVINRLPQQRKGNITRFRCFKDELQSARIQLSLGEAENAANGDIGDDETQSPWQTGVHGQPSEEDEPSETEAPIPLRRSTRTKKPNPKYANVAIVEDANAKETRDICRSISESRLE